MVPLIRLVVISLLFSSLTCVVITEDDVNWSDVKLNYTDDLLDRGNASDRQMYGRPWGRPFYRPRPFFYPPIGIPHHHHGFHVYAPMPPIVGAVIGGIFLIILLIVMLAFCFHMCGWTGQQPQQKIEIQRIKKNKDQESGSDNPDQEKTSLDQPVTNADGSTSVTVKDDDKETIIVKTTPQRSYAPPVVGVGVGMPYYGMYDPYYYDPFYYDPFFYGGYGYDGFGFGGCGYGYDPYCYW